MTSTPASPPQGAVREEFPNEAALRHYVNGRLLEERGEGTEALGELYRAMLLDYRAASLALRVSELSARLGDAERSLEFADRALGLEPKEARGLWLKGNALLSLGRAGESLEYLQAAVDADSDRIEYLQSLARAAESLDRVPVVARAYGRAVQLDEEDGESWFQLAAARARLQDFRGAEGALTRAVQLNPMRPGIFFLQGWVREGLGYPQQAIELYRRHLSVHVGDQATRRRLVNLLTREKRYPEAYLEAKAVSRARPDDVEAVEVEAELAFLNKRTREAERLTDSLRREAKDDPERLSRVIALMTRHGRKQAGIAVADDWSSRHAGDIRGPLLAAQARAFAGQTDRALEQARRAVETWGDSLAPRVMLGRLLQSDRRYREAEKVWQETLVQFPTHVGSALDLAYCREQLGDVKGAEQAARDALKLEPENARALNFLGYLLADHDQSLNEATELIRRALEKDPDNGAYIDSLGWVYYRLGRLADARVQLERAVHLTGGDPVVHEHLGDVYKDMRLLDLAKQQYEMSLAGDGSNQRVKAKLAEVR